MPLSPKTVVSQARPRGPRAVPVDAGRILDAAQEVFARQGLEGASLRAIAQHAGCDPKLIYYHFKGKEEIFRALMCRGMDPLIAEVQQIISDLRGKSIPETLWRVLMAFHGHLAENSGLRQLIRGEMAQGSEPIRDSITQKISPMIHALGGVLQEGIHRGEVRKDLNPVLHVFFMVRMELEILDLLPSFGPRMLDTDSGEPTSTDVVSGLAPDTTWGARGGRRGSGATGRSPLLMKAEGEWFGTFWRGISANPNSDPIFQESRP